MTDKEQSTAKNKRAQVPTASGKESLSLASGKPVANQNLDSFEAVMKAMDDELARARSAKLKTAMPDSKGKGKAQDSTIEEGQDIEAAMEAELRASLEHDEDEENEEIAEGDNIDYNLIKNFLESFKSQDGSAGPVSSLAGRLQPGWKLPRDG